METAVVKLGRMFRSWQQAWDAYDKGIGDKPKSYDEFMEHFIQLEKEQTEKTYKDGYYDARSGRFVLNYYEQLTKQDK